MRREDTAGRANRVPGDTNAEAMIHASRIVGNFSGASGRKLISGHMRRAQIREAQFCLFGNERIGGISGDAAASRRLDGARAGDTGERGACVEQPEDGFVQQVGILATSPPPLPSPPLPSLLP
jgi:hypothetical protein